VIVVYLASLQSRVLRRREMNAGRELKLVVMLMMLMQMYI